MIDVAFAMRPPGGEIFRKSYRSAKNTLAKARPNVFTVRNDGGTRVFRLD